MHWAFKFLRNTFPLILSKLVIYGGCQFAVLRFQAIFCEVFRFSQNLDAVIPFLTFLQFAVSSIFVRFSVFAEFLSGFSVPGTPLTPPFTRARNYIWLPPVFTHGHRYGLRICESHGAICSVIRCYSGMMLLDDQQLLFKLSSALRKPRAIKKVLFILRHGIFQRKRRFI